MFELIKQILKSFKHNVVLLLGLLFIGFAIVFTSISSSYFSNNIENSYTSLNNYSNLGTVIAPASKNDFKTSSLKYDISDDLFTPISEKAKDSSNNPIYFNSYKDYVDVTKSFAYPVSHLYHSSFVGTANEKGRNIIFAYYNNTTNSGNTSSANDNNNPYFTANGINDPSSLWYKRARGILYSYGEATIPTDSTKWRAFGIRLRDDVDLQNIVYEINPLSGNTDMSSNFVNTLGYFSDGYLSDDLPVFYGNMLYPSNVTASDAKGVEGKDNAIFYQYKNNGKPTPFFATNWTNSTWVPNVGWDLKQWGNNELESLKQIATMLSNGVDIFNILPSISGRTNGSISLAENVDWNLASLTPEYEYMKILRDKSFLTNNTKTSTNSSNVGTGATDLTTFSDFVFSIHLDQSNLTDLEKNTLNYVRQTYGDKTYSDLVSFVYTVNGYWLQQKLKQYTTQNITTDNLKSFNDLNKPYPINANGTTNKDKTITPAKIIKGWIENYSVTKLDNLKTQLVRYEKEYIASQLSKVKNIEFNNQKSFTINDANSSVNYLVSRKDYDEKNDKYQSNNVNKLVYMDGSKLQNSSKYLDIANHLFDTEKVRVNMISNDEKAYPINPDGNYLINLVKYIKDSSIQGISSIPVTSNVKSDYQVVTELADKILSDYNNNYNVNPNDYYHLFAMVTPDIYHEGLVTTNNQNITLNFQVKYGYSPSHFLGTVTYATPYGSAAVVTDKWLEANKKTIVSPDEWKKALSLSTPDYLKWLNDLDASKSIVINSKKFAIIGIGVSAENAYPITSIFSALPNTNSECLIYVNDQGYQSILSTSSLSEQDDYFAVASTDNKDHLSEINNVLKDQTNPAYHSNDVNGHKNLLTMRIGMPKMLIQYIQLFSIILITVIVLIGIYLCFLLIKIYIEKNQISLAIVKANGMSTLKIVISLSTVGFLLALISSVAGYLLAFGIQFVFYGIISDYWFVPVTYHGFSILGILIGMGAIYLLFTLFTYFRVSGLFKTSINDILQKETELKINKLLYVLKSRKLGLQVMPKFRISLSFTKFWRLFLMSLLCSFGLAFISLGTSIPKKFDESYNNTTDNINYKYSFDLKTPTEQGGLYKLQNYSDLGVTNDNLGIYNIYQNVGYQSDTYPYATLMDDATNKNLLALRNVVNGEEQIIPGKYYTNLLLPSYVSYLKITNDPQFFRNAVASKWLLDFQMNFSSISVNIWDYVSSSFDPELISKINALSNNFLDKVMEVPYIAKANDNVQSDGTKKPFLTYENGQWKIQSKNVLTNIDPLNLDSLRFNDEFLKFIGLVYGYGYGTDQNLSQYDAKIAFGIVPYQLDSQNKQTSETYTYLDTTFNSPNIKISPSKNSGRKILSGFKQEILGIKKDSSYVNLVNSSGKNIDELLIGNLGTNDNPIYPIIINNGAAYKYNLSIGQKFSTTVENTYDRYTKKIEGDNSTKSATFQVVGISSDSFGTQMYISQENANQILGMNFNQGAYIYGTSVTNHGKVTTTLIGDPNALTKSVANDTNYPFNVISYKNYLSNYVPFNGIFSKEDNPLQLRNLTLFSNNGIWGNFQKFTDDDTFRNYISNSIGNYLVDWIIPYGNESLNTLYKTLLDKDPSKSTNIRKEIIDKLNNQNLDKYLQGIFGNNEYFSILNTNFFGTLFNTYTSIFGSLITIENLVLILLLPIIIFTIMIISSTTLNDFKRILLSLKTLGFSDLEILKSIFVNYGISFIFAMIAGILIFVALLSLFQFLIFGLSSIYITSAIQFLPVLYGVLAILLILLSNVIYVAILFKRLNLKNYM